MKIKIGGYYISPYPIPLLPGGVPNPDRTPYVWIENQLGEGMGMARPKMEAALRLLMDEFWAKNF